MKSITRDSAIARAVLLQDSPQRFVLGVVGKPGVGKSTFTDDLHEQLSSELVAILPMDGFHMSNEKLIELGRRERKGAPDTFDVDDFAQVLANVRDGHGANINFPIFSREIEASIPNAGVVAAGVKLVIVEGNYLLHDQFGWEKISNLLDETWFLNVDDDLRMERLIARHIEFGKSPEDAKAWSEGTDEANARLIQLTQPRADYEVKLD
jgi:pantothenate kinase